MSRDIASIARPTIAEALAEFLAEQRQRLAPKTFRQYQGIVELFQHSLNGYAYQGLGKADAKLLDGLSEGEGPERRNFCEIFGPAHIPPNVGEFLGYFMVRKVIAGKDFLRAAGTVMKKLGGWFNFPTKRHWRGKSRYADIRAGLDALIGEVKRLKVRSIAVPPLGCGLGGLDWRKVRPMIEAAFAEAPDVRVMLFEPAGAPKAEAMPVRTQRPRMTVARALFISLMAQYAELAYRLTLLETQKLAYFLQEAGEPLRLRYEAGFYGPYAANLNKVLEMLEGHFIRGYGDSQRPDDEIDLLPGAAEVAKEFLRDRPEIQPRLDAVSRLISGFETPYGMELLSSVHWVATHSDPPAKDADSAVRLVTLWNDRKREMFRSEHIRVAWERLADEAWVTAGATE